MTERHERIWVGIDADKAHRWAVRVNAGGEKVFPRNLVNCEDDILA
ncbi:hypothetical protein [Streptomyces sp. NPDC005303]